MATLSIAIPDEDLDFLRSFAHGQGTTPEHWLSEHARALRLHLQRPLHPAVTAATGVLLAEPDPQAEYRNYIELRNQ